tara:strand:+ start:246 stop:587 length:342 start_codon:yes stop_codon:yes gene_type:complete
MDELDFLDDFLQYLDEDDDDDELELQTLVMCGCGNHMINTNKDPYTQHNQWIEGELEPELASSIESPRSFLEKTKGINISAPKPDPSYDFSGEEFEVPLADLRNARKHDKGET